MNLVSNMNIIRSGTALLAISVLVLGCAAGPERVTDFSDRSVVFGWIDIGDVDANRLHRVQLYQLSPHTDSPYWNPKFVKFEGGYLYYAFSFPSGTFKLYELSGQRCVMILCGNNTFSYSFGRQGDIAATQVDSPGVYYVGAIKLEEVKTGFFEAGKFDIQYTDQGPTERQMLEEMLADARDVDPMVVDRLNAHLQRL